MYSAGILNHFRLLEQPTIDPNSMSAVEVHLLDKEINLLGHELIIEPVQRIRLQKKFENIEALSKQISLDAILAKEILTKINLT